MEKQNLHILDIPAGGNENPEAELLSAKARAYLTSLLSEGLILRKKLGPTNSSNLYEATNIVMENTFSCPQCLVQHN